jgi:hypothetical protein
MLDNPHVTFDANIGGVSFSTNKKEGVIVGFFIVLFYFINFT